MEQDARQVAIVEQKFAQRFWPHDDPIGKRLWFDPKKPFLIVGSVHGTDIRRISGERVKSELSGVDGGKTRLQGDCVEGSETQSPSR